MWIISWHFSTVGLQNLKGDSNITGEKKGADRLLFFVIKYFLLFGGGSASVIYILAGSDCKPNFPLFGGGSASVINIQTGFACKQKVLIDYKIIYLLIPLAKF